MSLGERLLEYRKNKRLSQEEVAEKLNVTRQTISKWETDQSSPELDKIIPICELFEVSTNELLKGEKQVKEEKLNKEGKNTEDKVAIKEKKAKGISLGVLLYFIAIIWIMLAIPVLNMNPIVASAIFLLICGFATYVIVYTCIKYVATSMESKKQQTEKETKEYKLRKQIEAIFAIIITIIYLTISMITNAWHITWIIWIVMGLVSEILKLIFILRSQNNEK